ncbi:DnaJ family domain-containing protein [Fundidesulfovibrio soli]|uniref:DnaJ family domain-containing protein n=1 Tax=Fundidesulfovibrio soli TaxID=2922716 RepID=UPI001FAEFA17|nr:DnaJ family domain-containing protein [Fundidesulfovibrio soli]
MFKAIAMVAEERIRTAMERGEFDNLSCAGQPLDLDDDAHVPPELRMAYRLLKNGGYLDDDARLEREISDVESLMPRDGAERTKLRQMRKLQVIESRFQDRAGRCLRVKDDDPYYEQVVDAVSVNIPKERP